MAAVAVGVAANVWLSGRVQLADRMPRHNVDPALMRYKAREALAALGHADPPADSALR